MRLLSVLLALPLLGQSPIDHGWEILGRGLHDGNPAKRIQTVTAMGIIRPEGKVMELLNGALKDKDYGVRQAACVAMGQMKSAGSIPKLHEVLNDNSPEVVFAAAKALYDLGDPLGRQVLVAVLLGEQADSSGFFKTSMRDMKAKMHDPKGLVLLGVKEGAGAFLGPAGVGIPAAEGLLKDANASGRTVAAAVLASDKDDEALRALKQGLKDKNWTVRAAAARALALGGRSEAFDEITPLLDDRKEEVQYSAAAAVIRLKQPAPAAPPAVKAPAKGRKRAPK